MVPTRFSLRFIDNNLRLCSFKKPTQAELGLCRLLEAAQTKGKKREREKKKERERKKKERVTLFEPNTSHHV
jgi:hypothetical protein